MSRDRATPPASAIVVPPPRFGLDSSTWYGLGILGILLFLVGIYKPALGHYPDGGYLQLAFAVGGAMVAVLGFSSGLDAKQYERLHPKLRELPGRAKNLAIGPTFEVYRPGKPDDPKALPEPEPDPEPPPEE